MESNIEGESSYRLNEINYRILQDQYLIIHDGDIFQIPEPDYPSLSIHAVYFTRYSHYTCINYTPRRPLVNIASCLNENRNLFDEIHLAFTGNNCSHLADYLSSALLYFIEAERVVRIQKFETNYDDEKSGYVEKAINYMRKHVSEDISASQLALKAGCGRSTLFDLFRQKKQITPHEFHIQLKIDLACRLLLETDMAVKDIAPKVGISNHAHFTRLFNKEKGMTPKEYRAINCK